MSVWKAIQVVVRRYNEDSTPISFVENDKYNSTQNLNQLEPSFMYTQIFKEILLEIEHDEKSIENFTTCCHKNNYGSSTTINQFRKGYNCELAIWWYTCPSFIYSLVNHALRMLEADIIINVGFFIRDLHRQIEDLYHKQISSFYRKPFIVYRGHGLSQQILKKCSRQKWIDIIQQFFIDQ